MESGMVCLDVGLGTLEKILGEIRENVDGRFSGWQWG